MIAQSNNLSQLTASLAGALYGFGGNPFDERILVLPDTHMKQPIFEALTRQTESRVAAGLKVMNLAQALEAVSGEKLPTLLELSLFLETRLLRHLNDKAFAPIAQYLEKEVRIAPLCEVMSRIFWDYALFGEAALASWSQKAGWQQVLWNEVNEAWVLPHRLEVRVKKALYLFGFAYLPPLYLRFFSQAEAQFFFFSPCNVFFADYASDRQKLFLGRQEGFKATLEGQHKLLANLGKLAMSMQASIEDIGGATEEPFTIKEGATLLDAFQRDMTEGEVLSSPESDDTIQIFSAPTRLREVEVLKDKLLPLLTGDQPLKPTDILIVAPDIANYAAALKSVFESEEYTIPLVIEGLPEVALNSDAKRLQGLFDLVKERFALQPLFQFLEGMPGLSKEELFQMRRFAEEAEVRWGLNSEQRAAFSGAGGSGGTWEESLTRLARSMAFLEGPQVVGQSDWEVAGRLFHLLEEMTRDLKPFWDGLKRSVDVWARYFLAMIEKYIGQNFEAPKELRHLAFGFKEQAPISFESARRMVDQFLNRTGGATTSHQKMAIKCTSIKEGAIWPHQVVALLGVEEGVFPRAEEPTALFDSELESGQRPRKNDRDRTLMLQLLLAPEKKLFLSYSLQEEGGSHLLRELRAFLQEAYGLSLEVEEHPLLPFDPIYFKEGSELATHSNSHYRAALIHAEQQKREFLLPSFYVKRTSQPIEVCASNATLQQLEKFARNPLKYYLNESLQFYPDSLDVDLERGEFSLSPLKRYQLAQKALKGSLDEVIQEARLQGIFPAGTLGALAEDHLIFDVAQRESQLEKLGVEKGDLFEVVLHPFYRQWTQLKPTLFGAPPVKLGGGLEITGTLGPLCSKGLLCFGEDNLEGWVRSWPAYLVFQHLPHLQGELLSMKKGKAMTSSPHDPTEALESYLRYFAKSSVDPSPLMPEWLSFFLSRDVVGLEKKLEQLEVVTTGVFVDPSWQWLVRRDGLPRASALIANWSDLIVQTFGGYFDL